MSPGKSQNNVLNQDILKGYSFDESTYSMKSDPYRTYDKTKAQASKVAEPNLQISLKKAVIEN